MRAVPNMVVLVPADGEETRQVILAAAQYVGPVYIRMGRLAVPVLFGEEYHFEIGKANVLKEGTDVAIMANGLMVSMALEAAADLATEGISVSVVNVASVKPLDVETIVRVAKQTKAVVTAEEHNIIGGLGSAIAEVLGEEMPTPMVRVGLKDTFGESGRPQELLEKYGLTKTGLVNAVHKVLAKKLG